MARQIPEVVRAFAGLAATVLDETRKLPMTLTGLPVRLIGQALQASLKLQQQYSGLVARGDEVFTGLRGAAEPGMATFDEDDERPSAPAAATPAPRSSAFDRVGDLPTDTVAEELADDLADELAVADLPVADSDGFSDEASAAVLAEVIAEGADDMSEAEVAALPDDPIADAVTAVVDELAAEVADEVATEMPDAVPDEVLEDLTADTVADVADDEVTIEEAVAEELIAEPVVAGDPAAEPAAVPTLDDVTADEAPEQTRIVDDAVPDVAALDDATEELVDLGGPEAAESVTPDNPITDSAASEPLVAPGPVEGTEDGDQTALAIAPTDDQPAETPEAVEQADGEAAQDGDRTAVAVEQAEDQPAGAATPTQDEDQPTEQTGDQPAEMPEAVEQAEDQPAGAATPTQDGDQPTEQTDGQPAEAIDGGDQSPGPSQDGDQPVAADAAADGAGTAATSPVEGYDSFSIPALRGRLRGYSTDTVAGLLDYERANQARPPYVTLLQNRLEKLSRDRG
jgi:hypothetical protein